MQAKLSQLQFVGYRVMELYFEPKQGLDDDDATIEYAPHFEREIRHVQEDDYLLRLSVAVGELGDDMPFRARVGIEGKFSLTNVPDPVKSMKINATAILFPYLRSSLTQLTSLANLPPLVLPTYNIVDMFQAQEDAEKASVDGDLPEAQDLEEGE